MSDPEQPTRENVGRQISDEIEAIGSKAMGRTGKPSLPSSQEWRQLFDANRRWRSLDDKQSV